VLVTSGAVGAGMGALGYEKRPGDLAELQACAAVGQSRLMATYADLFAGTICTSRRCCSRMTTSNITSAISTRATRSSLCSAAASCPSSTRMTPCRSPKSSFGDNDTLSALVASLLPADLLVILTTVDGVIENFSKANRKQSPSSKRLIQRLKNCRGHGQRNRRRRHGFQIQAAKIAVRSGIPLVIASGKKKNVLAKILAGENEGTLFVAHPTKFAGTQTLDRVLPSSPGRVVRDERREAGPAREGQELLPPGVARCEGEFAAGDVVRICDLNGTEFARGIAKFGAAEVRGRKLARVEVVHRDDLVIL